MYISFQCIQPYVFWWDVRRMIFQVIAKKEYEANVSNEILVMYVS
jgi:hypothetical protein